MANKIVTVTIGSSTTSTGPYNVYKTSISADNLLEENVSLNNMTGSRSYRIDTNINQIIIVNKNSDCCCSTKTLSV
jgi:hypothetical protein